MKILPIRRKVRTKNKEQIQVEVIIDHIKDLETEVMEIRGSLIKLLKLLKDTKK